MFDRPFSQPLDKEPEQNAPETGTAEFVLHRPIDPLPDELSDVIVVGAVKSYQPYLSNDHGTLYTEFYIFPNEILKDSTRSIKPGSALAVLQRGGMAKLSNGKVIQTMPASGGNSIDVNKTYLLFLSYHRDANSYSVVKAWELVDNKPPIELDPNGKPKAKVTVQYASLTDLLNTLKAKVASH